MQKLEEKILKSINDGTKNTSSKETKSLPKISKKKSKQESNTDSKKSVSKKSVSNNTAKPKKKESLPTTSGESKKSRPKKTPKLSINDDAPLNQYENDDLVPDTPSIKEPPKRAEKISYEKFNSVSEDVVPPMPANDNNLRYYDES